jgi:hypothetical protein
MGYYNNIEDGLRWLFYLAAIGGVSLIFGAVWLLYFLTQHVTMVLH